MNPIVEQTSTPLAPTLRSQPVTARLSLTTEHQPRLATARILGLIVLTQLIWLAALVYAIVRFIT